MNSTNLTKLLVSIFFIVPLYACGGNQEDVPNINDNFVEAAFNGDSTEKLAIICNECIDLQDFDNEHLSVHITNTETGEELEAEIDEMGNFSATIDGVLEEDIELHIETFDGDTSDSAVVVTMIEPEVFETETVDIQDRPR